MHLFSSISIHVGNINLMDKFSVHNRQKHNFFSLFAPQLRTPPLLSCYCIPNAPRFLPQSYFREALFVMF